MFVAASFTIAEIWKQPRCSSASEWIKIKGCVCIYICICVCVCVYIYTYTYTHTHTYIYNGILLSYKK